MNSANDASERSADGNRVIRLKRAYQDADDHDGMRVLVDRMWPRGVSKDKAQIDEWLKDVAPSSDLRKWFGHDPQKFDEFSRRYADELRGSDAFDRLKTLVDDNSVVTLVFGAKDETHNQAVVLRSLLES